MIQRIQTIWLLLAGLTVLSLLFVPMVSSTTDTTTYEITASGLFSTTNGVEQKLDAFLPLMISTVIVALFCFVNIFNYRKRFLQKRGIFIAIVLMLGLSFWCSRYAAKIPGGLDTAKYEPGVFLPMIAIIFAGLAIRGINKDEKLIQSAERLR